MKRSNSRARVVVIGAGFGGLAVAKRLAGKAVDVTIVDRRNHHVFQPLLYQVATAALSPADIASPIRSIFAKAKNVRVLLDEVTGVFPASQRVVLARGGTLAYDYLVVATGASTSYFGNDDWAPFAQGLKSIDDAVAIRRQVLTALELAEEEPDRKRRTALLTFVVIGGGPTGVEMAGALAELTRRSVAEDFRSITPQCARVILIEAGERLLPAFPAELSQKARESLQQLGVECRLNSPVRDLGDGFVKCGDDIIVAKTIVWGAGVKASPAANWLKADCDRGGRVLVDSRLRVIGETRVFAIGDTASAFGKKGMTLPAVAPVAKQQGRFVADFILGKRTRAFVYRDFGNLATIGRNRAVIDMFGLHLSGFAAWLLWSVAHIWFLIGFRSRIAVSINWLWSYLTQARSARLITGKKIFGPSVQCAPAELERKCA